MENGHHSTPCSLLFFPLLHLQSRTRADGSAQETPFLSSLRSLKYSSTILTACPAFIQCFVVPNHLIMLGGNLAKTFENQGTFHLLSGTK